MVKVFEGAGCNVEGGNARGLGVVRLVVCEYACVWPFVWRLFWLKEGAPKESRRLGYVAFTHATRVRVPVWEFCFAFSILRSAMYIALVVLAGTTFG